MRGTGGIWENESEMKRVHVGMIVAYHLPRGGVRVGKVIGIDYSSGMAKAYGPQVETDTGSATLNDCREATTEERKTYAAMVHRLG